MVIFLDISIVSSATNKIEGVVQNDHDTAVFFFHGPFLHRIAKETTSHKDESNSCTVSAKQNDDICALVDIVPSNLARLYRFAIDSSRQFFHQHFLPEWYETSRLESQQCH
jgi:hypothetical protein